MTRSTLRAAAALAAFALSLASGPTLAQQNPHPTTATGGPSSLPTGSATVRGVVADPDNPTDAAGLTVALYALMPDGTPGIGSTETAADGSFSFESVSNDPAIVYLVGVRYAGVPYGERTGFAQGQQAIDIALAVGRPTAETSGIEVALSTIRIEAMGSRLAVEEVHTLTSSGKTPVLVPEAARAAATPPFEASLPDGALDFQTGVFNDTGAFEQRGERVLYWGPVYSGEQEIRFGYQLPVTPGSESVTIEKRFPRGTGSVRVMTPSHGPEIESAALTPGEAPEADPASPHAGAPQRVQDAGAQAPGAGFAMTVRVPKTTRDAGALSLGGAELSVELDDTVLEVTQSQSIRVAPGAHVAGSAGEPLLRFELPLRAELVGLSADAGRLGIGSVEQGIEVVGPLGPGTHDFAFRYRLPANPEGTILDLRFPMTVPSLQLRAADTGLVVESDRLHRLRPEAIGTRTWIMHEAFHVEPDEILAVRFVPLDARGPSSLATVSFLVAAAALLLLFVVAPLRRIRQVRGREADDRHGAAHERDLVYATIRDLEHDFETGKVAESDFERTRAELWARAVELMRRERGSAAKDEEAPETSEQPEARPEPVAATSGFCPGCGGAVDSAWQFCSHCGGPLAPAAEGGEKAG